MYIYIYIIFKFINKENSFFQTQLLSQFAIHNFIWNYLRATVPVLDPIVKMITDMQLAVFANIMGVSLFILVVLYHFISVNGQKIKESE